MLNPKELLKKAEEENKRFQKIGKIITTNNEVLDLPKLTTYKEMRDACLNVIDDYFETWINDELAYKFKKELKDNIKGEQK